VLSQEEVEDGHPLFEPYGVNMELPPNSRARRVRGSLDGCGEGGKILQIA
jgi:hypothetical protein